jgi:hypothetical protein
MPHSERIGRTWRLWALIPALACAATIVHLLHGATDFPTDDPVRTVDAALVDHLRRHPGLHLALAEDARFQVALDLADDAQNRSIYGTRVDLREQVPRRAIHVQRTRDRGAIHADLYNPRHDPWSALLHGTLEVPILPLALGVIVFAAWALWPRRPAAVPPR